MLGSKKGLLYMCIRWDSVPVQHVRVLGYEVIPASRRVLWTMVEVFVHPPRQAQMPLAGLCKLNGQLT